MYAPHRAYIRKERDMSEFQRNEFQNEVVRELLESKAIDIEAINAVFSKYGERAALEGESLVQLVHPKLHWICFPIEFNLPVKFNVDVRDQLR